MLSLIHRSHQCLHAFHLPALCSDKYPCNTDDLGKISIADKRFIFTQNFKEDIYMSFCWYCIDNCCKCLVCQCRGVLINFFTNSLNRVLIMHLLISLLLQEGKVKLRNKDIIQVMLLLSSKGQWFLFMLTIYQSFLCH